MHAVADAVGTLVEGGYPPVILTTPAARAVLKDLTRADLPRLVVLSQREIPRDTPIEILGKVVEEEPADGDDLHDHGGARMNERSPCGSRCQSHSGKAELMRSKTYRASTMKEAMTRVRRDLGGDAVILSAREVRRRRLFGLGRALAGRGHRQRHACPRMPGSRVQAPARPGWSPRRPIQPAKSPAGMHVQFGDELGRLHAMVENLSRQGHIEHLLPDLPASWCRFTRS